MPTEQYQLFDAAGDGGFQSEIAAAQSALTGFAQGPAKDAADQIAAAFSNSGARITRALGAAATGGEAAFKRLAQTAANELAKIAVNELFPRNAGGSSPLSLFGARAAGGDVVPGGAYLVGESGPELFTPSSAGSISPNVAGGAVNVHFHLGAGADAQDIRRNQSQIAAQIARAVSYGRRNL